MTKPLADRLTRSQRDALLVLLDRYPGPASTSNRNGRTFIASSSARVLVRHGLAAWAGVTLSPYDIRVRITDNGRALANGIKSALKETQ